MTVTADTFELQFDPLNNILSEGELYRDCNGTVYTLCNTDASNSKHFPCSLKVNFLEYMSF